MSLLIGLKKAAQGWEVEGCRVRRFHPDSGKKLRDVQNEDCS